MHGRLLPYRLQRTLFLVPGRHPLLKMSRFDSSKIESIFSLGPVTFNPNFEFHFQKDIYLPYIYNKGSLLININAETFFRLFGTDFLIFSASCGSIPVV